EEDIPFLESLSSEKSKKVKEEALQLLKQIPGSAITKQYEEILKQAVIFKKEKALLGMISKTVVQFKMPASIDAAIYKTGIDKLSSNKEFSDDEFIVFQLIQAVPLSFWEKHFESDPAAIIDLFQKDPIGKKMIPALVIAITRFRNKRWALKFMQS